MFKKLQYMVVQKYLDNTNSIKVKVDVNNLKSNKDYTVTIKKPAGIREISEKVVTAKGRT